jgi:hypothetical protein
VRKAVRRISPVLAALACAALFVSPARSDPGPKFALHVHAPQTNPCAPPLAVPCSHFVTEGDIGTSFLVYLVVAQVQPADGVSGISCGIRYDPAPGSGVDVSRWYQCADGLPFPNAGDYGEWPASGGGMRLTWVSCADDPIPGYTSEGAVAVAGAFSVYAYSADSLVVTPNNNLINGPELALGTCIGRTVDVSTANLGRVAFSSEGGLLGFNPCTGGPGVPPPPPPTNPAAIVLHIGAVVDTSVACASAPQTAGDVVTSAPASLDGSAEYFVYLLSTPVAPSDEHVPVGLRGMQLGISYDQDTPEQRGIKVHSWTACSDLDFSQDEWPVSGAGTTLT